MSHFIGVDVGGTNIVCGLFNDEGTLVAKSKAPTEAKRGCDSVISKIAQMIASLTQEAGLSSIQSVSAVGVGTPGFVDPEQGITIFAGNLRWTEVPVAQLLSDLLQIPVFVDNDVRMYVYGEAMKGAGVGYRNVLGITLGTGLAAAFVHDGQLYYGGGFMAGEIGHIVMEGESSQCGCGMRGCLETVASATGIARQARDRIGRGQQSILAHWHPDLQTIRASDVSKAFDAGDEVAIEVLNHTGRLLGKGLSYAVTLLSPDIIVIGGGAALAGDRLFAPMREELQKSVYHGYWSRLTIAPAIYNDDAGIVGSALLAKHKKALMI